MSTLHDEIKRATGGLTVNEGLSDWFSRTATESLKDAEARWLFAQVTVLTYGHINDMWREFLLPVYGLLAGSEDLNDMKFAYWSAQP